MLAVVGWLAGTTLAMCFGFFIAAFGVWDILVLCRASRLGWLPRSWNGTFSFSCPVCGMVPVLAPVFISLSFIVSCACLIVAECASGHGIRATLPRVGLLALGWTI